MEILWLLGHVPLVSHISLNKRPPDSCPGVVKGFLCSVGSRQAYREGVGMYHLTRLLTGRGGSKLNVAGT